MNHPPQIGSRVRWWDARGKTKHGSVKAINILSDNSHIIVIQVEDGQPPTVSLPSVRMTCGGAKKHDVNACRTDRDYHGRGIWKSEEFRSWKIRGCNDTGIRCKWCANVTHDVQLDANVVTNDFKILRPKPYGF
ncbi:hypothetical protein V8E53_012587 [Lactarius tabidus]